MRLRTDPVATIHQEVLNLACNSARVWLFGSRVRDDAHGGDVDLLVEMNEAVAEPALLSAQLGARVSRSMHGRKVDVLIEAPNLLRLPIHAVAHAEGVRL